MAKENAVYEYRSLLNEYGFRQKRECTEEENAKYLERLKNGEELPDNVGKYLDANEQPLNRFYEIDKDDMTHEERMEYLEMKQHKELVIIKGCAVFFVVVSVIGLVGSFLLR